MPSDVPFRVAEWLDSDSATVNHWIETIYQECLHQSDSDPLLPVVERLRCFIESNERVLGLFKAAFAEIPLQPPFDKDAFGNTQIRDYRLYLKMLNRMVTMPQRYEKHDWVGVPLHSILLWVIHTPSGFKLFLDEELNHHLKLVLNHYGTFLKSPESRVYLTEDPIDGWFSANAVSGCRDRDNQPVTFDTLYVCDTTQPFYGFSSWDDYFTRHFVPTQRPVEDAEDNMKICNACESAPLRIATNVQAEDSFWIKGQPYSLKHMLKDEQDMVSYFAGGTVYQAFLSALSYHRWHSPVNGRVVRTKKIDGSYYAHCPGVGFDETALHSQCYMTEVATRALIFIECVDPTVGVVCFVAVGMGEVSTCEVTCQVGDEVRKGDELGMFHFGGSTYCLLFGPQVDVLFHLGEGNEPSIYADNVLINKTIASLAKK